MKKVVGLCFDLEIEESIREVVTSCLEQLGFSYREYLDVSSLGTGTISLYFSRNESEVEEYSQHPRLIACLLDDKKGLRLPDQKEFLKTLIQSWWKSYKQVDRWKYLATVDEVTGLFNQRKMKEDLFEEMKIHDQRGKSFSVLFIDIDNFKIINDKYGHIIGSKLLSSMANIFQNFRKTTPYMYRYGGDEYVIILPETEADEALRFGEMLCHTIKSTEFVVSTKNACHLSVSIGISQYPEDASNVDDVIAVADNMMYTSKKSGKGKVIYKKSQ